MAFIMAIFIYSSFCNKILATCRDLFQSSFNNFYAEPCDLFYCLCPYLQINGMDLSAIEDQFAIML